MFSFTFWLQNKSICFPALHAQFVQHFGTKRTLINSKSFIKINYPKGLIVFCFGFFSFTLQSSWVAGISVHSSIIFQSKILHNTAVRCSPMSVEATFKFLLKGLKHSKHSPWPLSQADTWNIVLCKKILGRQEEIL